MWQPSVRQWWGFLAIALVLAVLWPPANGKSLAMKAVNWVVDPGGTLPTFPDPLDFANGDDVDAVNAHDLQVRMYDEQFSKGGWTRTRLRLKVASDPFDPTTERQVLVLLGVVAAFAVWRSKP